ncbi:hypothetical protein Z517_07956 [Fonsecaea pedrosoi CBS 271.37]|uniref:SET domain-containing protein n=1 Tax=Fonsecaea pedrosoi CBS 271.37 TaxID=1442368 RepID=A0A0D2GBU6_9EURO|nr:uncharacterized protein Z517_07956 [Fonsecaea pedrosoi CBS 271.37]KIW78123.1 hypothetical protein Z517_07956 [Fonsecaea pedrosoi CBS 271.37]
MLVLVALSLLQLLVTGTNVVEDTKTPAASDQVPYQFSGGDFGLGTNDSVSADADTFAPWSYKPACTAKISEIDSELCVYTDRFFSDGRGISIFTTPEVAKEFASLLASLKSSLKPDDEPGVNQFTGAWYTHPVAGKGIGMLAKHDLSRGDITTAYTPVLLAYKEDLLPKDEREKFLRLAIDQLPIPSREAYWDLATLSDDDDEDSHRAQEIAGANAFEIRLEEKKGSKSKASAADVSGSGTAHLAVIPEASRMNHDCAPNAIFYINASTLAHVVRATRPIRKGEEITIAYTNPLAPRAVRQKYLSDAFHFTCTCSRCLRDGRADTHTNAGSDIDVDAALSEIASLQNTLSRWSDPASDASVKHAERLVQLHRDEGLEGYLDPAYCYAALMYSAVGSLRGAQKYLALAIEAIELRLGPGAPDLPAWRAMLDDPTRHWSWMVRKRGEASGYGHGHGSRVRGEL